MDEETQKFRAHLRQDYPLRGISQLTASRIFIGVNHFFAVYGLYYLLTGHYSWSVLLFEFVYAYMGALGTTIGAHRYWTHKAFKAAFPLRVLLMCWQTISVQYSLYKWVLDHRIHHRYADTDKDPHNSKRGFWFSHLGWALMGRKPDHWEQLKKFDMPDLEKDPVILFQVRWYPWLVFLLYSFIPVQIVLYFSGLPRFQVDCLNCLRWVYGLHISAAVNSFAHIWGDKPYDKTITSTDNKIVALFSVGEGWHNYHHTFPWDYKASELGWKINFSTMLIDFFAMIGWAYDLKTVSTEMLEQKVARSGDGSHPNYGTKDENGNEIVKNHQSVNKNEIIYGSNVASKVDTCNTWGWDDENTSDEWRKMTKILNPCRKTDCNWKWCR